MVIERKGARGSGTPEAPRDERQRTSGPDLRLLADNLPGQIAYYDKDGLLRYANKQHAEFYGYAVADKLGKPIREVIGEDGWREVRPYIERGYRGESMVFERRVERAGREPTYLHVHYVPERSASGEVVGLYVLITDITAQKRAEAALAESEARFRSLVELSSDWYWEQDEQFRFTRLEGPTIFLRDDVLGKTRWELPVLDLDGAQWAEHQATLAAHLPFRDFVYKMFDSHGAIRFVSASGEPVFDEEGRFRGYRGTARDITDQKRTDRLRILELAVAHEIAVATDPMRALQAVIRLVCESEGWDCGRYFEPEESGALRFVCGCGSADPSIERFLEGSQALRYAPGVGLAGRVFESGEPLWASDLLADNRVAHKTLVEETGMRSAFVFPVLHQGRAIGVLDFNNRARREPEEPLIEAIHLIGAQIGQFLQKKRAEERLAYLAQFDPLTGLANRQLFRDRLQHAVAQAKRGGRPMAVLFIDLDHFKLINDTLGHATGDKLLHQAGTRIAESVRSGDTVGRFGDDEFAVILTELAKADDAGRVAGKIIAALSRPFDLEGREVVISGSIGITLFPDDAAEADALLMNASVAMYRAKEQGRAAFQYFTREMNERSVKRLTMETALRRALERGEFRLHYQPKIDLANGRVAGLEALLRWEDSHKRSVPPVEFIPVLEDTGLIVPVGEWVLASACAQLKAWEREGLSVPAVAVNLSARQFQQKNLDAAVHRALAASGLDPARLELEITESLLMHDPEGAVRVLRELKAIGVRLSVDDFGTGYSSLGYLKRFPLDFLKVDRTFVHDVLDDPNDAAITLAIIALAHNLGLRVLAEGVETEEQLDFLARHGCDQVQGFYFAKPVPAEECPELLAALARRPLPQALRCRGGAGTDGAER